MFIALKTIKSAFTSAQLQKVGVLSKIPVAFYALSTNILALLVLVLTVLFVSFLPLFASSQELERGLVRGENKVLHIYPSNVSGPSWSATDQALSRDLKEDALYQNFSARNSAYLPVSEDIRVNSSEPIGSSEVSTTTLSNTLNKPGSTSTVPITPNPVPSENTQNVAPTSSELKTTDQSHTSDATQPVVLKKTPSNFFALLSAVTKLFPFTHEIVTQEINATNTSTSSPIENTTSSTIKTVVHEKAITTKNNSTESIHSKKDELVTPSKNGPQKKILTFSNFSVPQLQEGEFITSAQLRMSLGAQFRKKSTSLIPKIEVVYKNASTSEVIGTITVEDEVSNALNGGYFLFALPSLTKLETLKNASIEVLLDGNPASLDGVYIDAAWFEVAIEKIDSTLLKEKTVHDITTKLDEPKSFTLLNEKRDFAREELPQFSLKYNAQRNIAVRFVRNLFGRNLATVDDISFIHKDAGDIGVTPKVNITPDGLLGIQIEQKDAERLKPGEYTIEIAMNEGGVVYQDSFTFQWGLLSINSDQTSYKPGSTVSLSLGALSTNGNTVCDASLNVYIIDNEKVVTKSEVTPSGVCNGNNVVDVPDYRATFVPEKVGSYEMYVERVDQNGNVLSHTSDTFIVAETLPLSIKRNGPSRIYPKEVYPMQLTVVSDAPWKGTLIEKVPLDFVITNTDAKISQKNGFFELAWDIDTTKENKKTVSYTFDAPDISPFLYNLGEARLVGEVPVVVVSKVPEVPKVSVPDVVKPKVNSSSTTASPTSTDSVIQLPAVINESVQKVATSQSSVGIIASTTLGSSTKENLPVPEKTLFEKIIDSLPFIGNQTPVQEVTPPATNVQPSVLTKPIAQEQVLGEVETSLGSSTLQTSVNQNKSQVSLVGATSSSIGSTTAQLQNSATGTVVFQEHRKWQIASDATGSMIVYWASNGATPAGWTCLSCGSGTFYQRFVKGGSVYNSTGGSATHSHSASGTVNATVAAGNSENNAGANVAVNGHSHTYTPTITASTSLPAYRNLKVIQFNSAGEPPTVPIASVLMFDTTLPGGWTRYTALDNRYPRGENALANAGTSTHQHTISGSTGAAAGSTVNGRAGGVQVSASGNTHTHTISASTGFVNHEPPFITVIFATTTSAVIAPTSSIAMWTDTPPAQWQNKSAQAGDTFFDNFIKGSATFGTVGGALTHTHADVTGITSSAAVGTLGARTGATGSNAAHTHLVDVTNFTSASNIPPFITAIFGRKFGAIPLFTQTKFKFFVNATSTTPNDAWPVGAANLLENEAIDASSVPVKNGDVIRLRMQLSVSNSTSTASALKLQFASTTDSSLCSSISTWTAVGSATSSSVWRGYDNPGISDGATLASSTLSLTDVKETYEEQNPTASTPNTIGIGKTGEWDFVLQQNAAEAGVIYCFRMVKSDNTALYGYTQYPSLQTNQAPDTPTITKLFDNEKVGTTTPHFEFSDSDTESNDLSYQVQISTVYNFSSTVVDKNSISNGTLFQNITTLSDKDPFSQGQTIQFLNNTALTNGTTYYVRIRAKDPVGSNTYGSWSTVRSFTIDTTVTLSKWFQTQKDQFNVNTFDGTYASTSNDVRLKTGSSTGTMYSAPIAFSDAQVGTAWGSFAFTHIVTSSNLKYTIQYDNSGTWTDIPDADLVGNSAGFTSSPVSLLGVDKTIYDTLRIKATFTNSGLSPILQDWAVTWGYLIETPTIKIPFSNEKVATTTPTFHFTTTDPQNDSLQYQVQWSSTYAFVASTTRNSNLNAGFTNITHATDTDPFNSGDTVQFKLQPGDALTNGNTYWWRVRARDPGGSNTYSFYTSPRSITVDTSVTVSTWFQTTQSQFAHDTLTNAYPRATDAITVSTTTVGSLMVYGEGNVTTPKYRVWDGNVWGAQQNALSVGATIVWDVTKASPIKNEYVTATMGTDADVNVQVYSNGSWGNLQKVTTSIPDITMRGFDVAYEKASGHALVVTCDGDSNPTYYIWNGSTWTNGGAVGITNGNTCGWVKLISNPTSNEIIAITRDTSGLIYEARVWNGSSWGNSSQWGSMQATNLNHEGIAAEYEESGNQAVVAVSNGTAASFIWRTWNGTTWSGTTVTALGNDFENGHMVADVGTDNLAMCYIDDDRDMGVMRWNGSAWAAPFFEVETIWTTASNIYNDKPIDCAFEVGGARDGFITAVYSTKTNTSYRSWNGASWSAVAAVSTLGVTPRIQLQRTGANLLQLTEQASSTDSYRYSSWNGTTWSGLQTLETDASVNASPYKQAFMTDRNYPSVIGTVTGEPSLLYADGSGPYWKQLSWNDTTPGSSDILYQIEYFDGTSWQLVPNTLIPGNSVGTTTSPIKLSNVLPVTTYKEIRPVANMVCSLGVCPTLSDWTLTWAAGINISGTVKAYDQSTNVTSGTVAVALNGVLQVGKTGSISGGVWTIANVNAHTGDVITVFLTGAPDANEAVGVTKYDGVGDITGINLFERHVSIGSDDLATVTNSDLSKYDFTNTEDIFYDVNVSNVLTVCATTGCGDAELYIKALNTYQPGSGGTINTSYFENNGTFKLNGNTMRVSRSWDNKATTSLATSTVIFTATSTSETLNETGAVAPAFYNLTFGETAGTAVWTLGSTLDVNGNLAVTYGTLARNSRTLTLAGNLTVGANGLWSGIASTTFDGTLSSTWIDSSAGVQNIGKVIVDGTTKVVTLGSNAKAQSITIGADDIFDLSSGNRTLTLYRNWKNNNTFNAQNGTVNFAATTTRVISVKGNDFYNLTFSGVGGVYSFASSTLGIGNDFTITAGTITMPSATTTIAGSFTNAGTFVHNNALVLFTTSGSKTITQAGTTATNAFYNVKFTGSGGWSFTEANATTSNIFRITQGNVTLPSNTLTVGTTFTNTGGTFTHNAGTVKFISGSAQSITTNSSFYSINIAGAGGFSFANSSVTAAGNVTVGAGTLTLPSSTLTIGGSLTNSATLTHNNGTVLFNATSTGKTINTGNSSLYNMTFNSASGGWTISQSATTTNNTTLTAANSFTLASGKRLSVGNVFTNSVGGAPTTWTGSSLVLQAGNYSLNARNNTGDLYDTLVVKAGVNISMWNSSASTYSINAAGSLYSQNNNAVNGDLYIFGAYTRSSGSEYWNYATDFDGTSLGTTSRAVHVKFASGASANFTNATLNIVGGSAATTTIANQGGGTYLVGVTAGTTTAQYYDFRNLGATGVSLLSKNKVTTLSNGFFSPGVGGGTALTVSSTTIDANPAKQILNVNFSTTSAIVVKNVTQVDGTPASYWWFRNSAGNIDGEAFDFDTGNPGSIRWDDSSLIFTVSGKVYTDDGVTPLIGGTCNGVATPVRVVVKGGTTYDGSCSAINGTYSIGGVTTVGDSTVTVFLNGASGGQRAVTVTKTPTGNISGLDLYGNRVVVRHQDVAPMTIADMASYDSTRDTDIFFTAATGTTPSLIVQANRELFVWATSTFTPGGTVTLRSGGTGTSYDGSLHIANAGTFVGAGTTTYSVGGTFRMDAGSTFTPASSTVLMTATTTGKGITVAAGRTATFNLLRFTGVGGGWNLNGDMSSASSTKIATGTLSGTGNISIPNSSLYGNGTLSLGGGTTTISRSNTLGGTRSWTFYNLVLGNGSIVGTTTMGGTATTTIASRLKIANAHFLRSGSSHFDLSGSGTVFIKNGSFLQDTSIVRYSGGSATNILSTNYYNLDLDAGAGTPTYTATGLGIAVLNNLTVGGQAATNVNFTTNDPALAVSGNVTVRSNGTLIGSDTGSFTVGGSWNNLGTYTSSNGTVSFTGSGSPTISAGTSAFGILTINGTGSFTINANATSTGAFNLTAATGFTLSSSTRLSVGGIFTNGVGGAATTWAGSTLRLYSGTNYQMNPKTKNDVYGTLVIGVNTDVRMWNSSATTYTVDPTGSLYSQDHSSVRGNLYVYGDYPGNGGTDYWSYAKDFDGTVLGTTSRQANVRFINGSTMTLVSGGLQVLGGASASTTLQNQGSGTYGMRIGGSASTSWSYYDVKNTNSAGLTFSGTPNVITLSRGKFEVITAAGSGITVGGTVITANPAKTFTNNIFATTTAITASNVTATGTTVSSWRFTNHSGNLAGEAHDTDPNGDPGYIVWDNSSANITVSGKVYSDEGVTVSAACNGVTNDVRLEVAGLTAYTTTCNAATGLYTINGVSFSPGDSMIVYIKGVAQKGVTVTKDPISNINNMDVYENRVIVRHEGLNSLTIADMAVWDSSKDADVQFTTVIAAVNTVTLPANRKLLVWSGKTFEPKGNTTISGGGAGAAYDGTLEAQTNGVVKLNSTQLLSIGGSFILGSGATFIPALSTTTFTTTGAARTIHVNNNGFYNVAFTGAGSWTNTDTVFGVRSMTMSSGALTLQSGTTTVGGSWINNGGSFTVGSSTLLFTASSSGKIIKANGSNFKAMVFNGIGGSWSMTDINATATAAFTVTRGTVSLPSNIFSIGGSFRNKGTITHNTSEIVMRSGSAATILASTSALYAITLRGNGPFTMSDPSLTLASSLTIAQGSITFATGTLSIGGSLIATGGTFAHASGTVLFNATTTGKTVNVGSSKLYNVVFGSASGGWTISANATTTRNFTISTTSSLTVASSTRLYVGNVFTNNVGGAATTWTGSTLVLNSGSTYAMNTKSTGGDFYQKIIIGANTNVSSWNSKATTTTMTTSGSLYSQNHSAQNGKLNIYGDYKIATGTKYWSYATDFDGTNITGSERNVTVSFAANATTTLNGGALNILGASTHETLITNQGAGNYAFKVTSGALNAQYYQLRNLNAKGLNFSGSPTVYSLSYGDFELAVAGGSLIKLASTTINANASLVITGNRFATTTAITGTNVNLTGSTTNAWTFTAHTGNLAGEVYDNDGATACGSIRWSNSACLITQQTHYRWRNDDGGIDVPNAEWFNSNWSKRKAVRLQNTDATTYTNAVVKVPVVYDSDMQTNFNDLRFTDAGGTTTLPFFVERYTASNDADVWVKVPTLTGADTTSVFMYYKNATASSTSSSTKTYIAADDFNDGNITEYTGDTTLFSADASFAYGGGYGLSNVGHENGRATRGIGRTGLTVAQGQIIRYLQYVNTTAGSGDEACTLFAMQSPITLSHNYAVCLEQFGVDRISLAKDVIDTDSSGVMLASSTVTYSTGWYEVQIDWKTTNDINVSLKKNGSLVTSITSNNSTYTTGGMGFTYWFDYGGWDNFTSRKRVDTEPTVRFGAKQTNGGASWKAVLDTGASYIIGNIARIRFAVENTGLQITGQTYNLEFAAQGAAPSCEAVSNASYVHVPSKASCGSSALCMATSTNIADNGATSDLLFGPNGTFTNGKQVADPSYTTGALTLNQNAYTELEYAVKPSINATAPVYCLRVSNAGAALDTYLKVAKLLMRFDPTVTGVSLNGGADMTMLPGATTTVYVTGTATDLNGYTDLALASSTIYRSGAGPACSANNNSCYISRGAPKCVFSSCAGNSCTVSCRADMYYLADATDATPYTGENWTSFIQVTDQAGGNNIGSAASGVELLSLRALNVSASINYGSLAVSSSTGSFNPTTTVQNIGNNPIDISLQGTNLTDGLSSTIPTSQQKFGTTSFTYSSCVTCRSMSTTTIAHYNADLAKPTSILVPVKRTLYWGIAIPFGVASNPHSGTNIFYAIADTP